MKNILKFIKDTYYKVLRSIAFYPVLMSIIFLILAFSAIEIENTPFISSIKKEIPSLFIQDYETARAILSTLIAGILSLTVFSFTMVMSVLSQASANFSPRLLPDLISNKKHQLILGVYIGTLAYCIIVLISLGAYGVDSGSLGLSTMFAALLGVICTGLFVYFIHNISSAIQIQNIVDSIAFSSKKYLKASVERNKKNKAPLKSVDTQNWMTIDSSKSGYFRTFDAGLIEDTIKEKGISIYVIPYVNEHVWAGKPLLKTKETVDDETARKLEFCVHLSSDRLEGDEGISGMIKLMEIAVKAMSPGVNDPGTAIDAIIKLAQLLKTLLQLPPITATKYHDQRVTIIEELINAEEAMRILIQPIRQYSKQDSAVCYVLIQALQFIRDEPQISNEKKAVLAAELEALKQDVENAMENAKDRQRVLSLLNY